MSNNERQFGIATFGPEIFEFMNKGRETRKEQLSDDGKKKFRQNFVFWGRERKPKSFVLVSSNKEERQIPEQRFS